MTICACTDWSADVLVCVYVCVCVPLLFAQLDVCPLELERDP